jgi:hypothetical protein
MLSNALGSMVTDFMFKKCMEYLMHVVFSDF